MTQLRVVVATLGVICVLLLTETALALQSKVFRKSRFSYSLNAEMIPLDDMVIERELIPVANGLLIKVKEIPKQTAGGLFIPDEAKERPTEGEVMAAGPGRLHPETAKLIEIAVKTGQKVLYGKYDGIELLYKNLNHQLIKDDDVLLTYTGDQATLESVTCVKDQVLIALPMEEEVTDSGIIMGKKEMMPGQKSGVGVVAKVGPGRIAGNAEMMEIQVTPGENVRFREFAGFEIKLDKKKYVVIRAYDILSKW